MANTLVLPAAGRSGEPPGWPFLGQTLGEQVLWSQLWGAPQAVAWERQGCGTARTVARYVRLLLVAEDSADPKLLTEVRQLEDRLGLSPMALLRLRWEIGPDEGGGQVEGLAGSAPADLKARLRAVD